MKNEMIALPVYKERISPLLDVAKKFAVYEIDDGEIRQKIIAEVHPDDEVERFGKLKEMGVSLIIGGAVSSFVSEIINAKGIRLISWINGSVDNVIENYLEDGLKLLRSSSSACPHNRRQRRCRAERADNNKNA